MQGSEGLAVIKGLIEGLTLPSMAYQILWLLWGLNPLSAGGGGVFRTPSNFAAFGDLQKVKYIEMFHADFSYLSIY